jgi:hypothetical protein
MIIINGYFLTRKDRSLMKQYREQQHRMVWDFEVRVPYINELIIEH